MYPQCGFSFLNRITRSMIFCEILGRPDPLAIIQEDAFVLLLLFLQDPDLLLEVVDGLPEFLVETTSQIRHHRKPQRLFHSPWRLLGSRAAGKRFRHEVAQGQP